MREIQGAGNQESGYLDVGAGHQIYWELWGHGAIHVLFLHGGPGAGFSDNDKRFFDPRRHRVLFFDQRGSGRSIPSGRLEDNNTNALLQDILRLMDYHKMPYATVFGGSWGSTLGLLLAIRHPDKVARLILRAYFPANAKCLSALIDSKAARSFENHLREFLQNVPVEYLQSPWGHYYQTMVDGKEGEKMEMAMRWNRYCLQLAVPDTQIDTMTIEPSDKVLSHALLTAYYATSDFFIADDFIADHASLVTQDIYLVHGVNDFLCPIEHAVSLQELIPQMKLEVVRGGHLSSAPEIERRLINAMDNL